MQDPKPPTTEADLLRAAADLFDAVEAESPEDADTVLRAAGLDPTAVASRILDAVRKAAEQSSLNWRNQEQAMLRERSRLEAVGSPKATTRQNLIAAIQRLASVGGRRTQELILAHRNLEQATDEDLATLLTELEYLAGNTDQEAIKHKEQE